LAALHTDFRNFGIATTNVNPTQPIPSTPHEQKHTQTWLTQHPPQAVPLVDEVVSVRAVVTVAAVDVVADEVGTSKSHEVYQDKWADSLETGRRGGNRDSGEKV
jgi:hypothetical protein